MNLSKTYTSSRRLTTLKRGEKVTVTGQLDPEVDNASHWAIGVTHEVSGVINPCEDYDSETEGCELHSSCSRCPVKGIKVATTTWHGGDDYVVLCKCKIVDSAGRELTIG